MNFLNLAFLGNIGTAEILVILLIVLLVFGTGLYLAMTKRGLDKRLFGE